MNSEMPWREVEMPLGIRFGHNEEEAMELSEVIRMRLVVALLEHSKREPNQYVFLQKHAVDSSLVRQIVADLRIQGHVEEQTRGVIRLTQLGFQVYNASQSISAMH
jgi:predicted transcriptional regulator